MLEDFEWCVVYFGEYEVVKMLLWVLYFYDFEGGCIYFEIVVVNWLVLEMVDELLFYIDYDG